MGASPASSSSDIPRILFLDVSSHTGGAERSLDELVAAIVAEGLAEVAVATARSGVDLPCPTFAIPSVRPRRMSHPISFMRSAVALFKARSAIAGATEAFSPNVVVANGIAAALALPRACTNGQRTVWIVRDMPRAPWSAIAAKRSGTVAAISPPVAETCAGVLPKSMRGKITLLGNGIDISRFPFRPNKTAIRSKLGLPADVSIVGMVANLVPWKRHDAFLSLAAKLSDIRDATGRQIICVVAGSDLFGEHEAYRRQLRRMAADAGIGDRFLWVEDADGTDVIPAIDILVHPALGEPFGRVVCEAMASGTPVVARASAGPASIIENGVTGYLGESDDEMASIVARLVTHPEMSKDIVIAARSKVEATYTAPKVASRLMSIIG